MSGGITIKVEKKAVSGGGTWKCYKHSSSGTFTLKKITHSDVVMKGSDLGENMNRQIGQDGGIYVYYQGDDINQPKVICISTGNPADPSNNTWYKADSTSSDGWTKDAQNFNNKNPNVSAGGNAVTADELNKAGATGFTPPGGATHIIKLDKRPIGQGSNSNIRYRNGAIEITVEKNTTIEGYVAYSHQPGGQLDNVKFRHSENPIELRRTETSNITIAQNMKVWVFYQKDDSNRDKPLLLYFKNGPTSSATNNWYGRGKKWEHHSKLTVDASAILPTGDDKDKIASKLNAILHGQV